MRVLIVEDNVRYCELITEHLKGAGFVVCGVHTAGDFRLLAADETYDLFLIDINLPDGSGIELIRELRCTKDATPVLVMTAQGEVDARIAGLEAGADDYLSKPFNNRELVARMRALLRRAPAYQPATMEVGSLEMDSMSGEVFCNGKRLELRASEQRLLALMIRRAGRIVPRSTMENALQSLGNERSPNAIDKLVSRLRCALGNTDTGLQLKTVRGSGYMLELKN
jgi:DNA-binding response OmpR family regulator